MLTRALPYSISILQLVIAVPQDNAGGRFCQFDLRRRTIDKVESHDVPTLPYGPRVGQPITLRGDQTLVFWKGTSSWLMGAHLTGGNGRSIKARKKKVPPLSFLTVDTSL
jgi:hypothetical protein